MVSPISLRRRCRYRLRKLRVVCMWGSWFPFQSLNIWAISGNLKRAQHTLSRSLPDMNGIALQLPPSVLVCSPLAGRRRDAQFTWRHLYFSVQPGSHFKAHFSHHTECPLPLEIRGTVTSGCELLLQAGRALTYPISDSPTLCRCSPALRQLRWTIE